MRRIDPVHGLAIDRSTQVRQHFAGTRALLIAGWALAAIGYYGPWIGQTTAALTLVGSDMGEFVKFVPQVLDGSTPAVRQLFYLPPVAVVLSITLLVGSRRLRFGGWLRTLLLVAAIPVSVQLLPPAWSVGSLLTHEFRLQALTLGVLWASMIGFWLWRHVPLWCTAFLSALMSLAAVTLTAWQFLSIKPAIDRVYASVPAAGWGFFVCMTGLGIMAVTGVQLVVLGLAHRRSGGLWPAD